MYDKATKGSDDKETDAKEVDMQKTETQELSGQFGDDNEAPLQWIRVRRSELANDQPSLAEAGRKTIGRFREQVNQHPGYKGNAIG